MTIDEDKGVKPGKAVLKNDPRFVRPKKKQTKLTVDDRFKGMFDGEEFQVPVKIDKYGRRIVDKRAGQDLKRFYQLEEEEKKNEDEASSSEEDASEVESDRSSSDHDSSSSDGSQSEEEPEMYVFEETLAHHPLVNQEVELCQATRRLALVNMDWDQIKALDVLHLIQGFKPITGVIESVKIYPSEFGKERLVKEAIEGPPKEIFKTEGEEEVDLEEAGKEKKPVMIDEGEDFNESQLRKYQLERLKYYYAVITCDTAATASAIYKHCDGAEFEMSANFLDLRYIPDNVSFDDDEPTDTADHTSKHYKPKSNIITPALQHSKVKLTWDMDDPDRTRLTKVNLANFDHDENDLKAYLASSSSGEEDEEETVDAEKYRQLLLSENGNVFGRKSHEDNADLQITFASGFNTAGAEDDGSADDVHMEATFNLSEVEEDEEDFGKQRADETVFEARLRRMNERKKTKKAARLAKIEEIKAAEKQARLDEKKAAAKSKKRRDTDDPQSKSAAELDLLMLEDVPDKLAGRHFDMAEILKAEKKSKGGGKRAKKDVPEDDFKLDVKDERFKAIFDEPAYSLDPTHASFKPTKAMKGLIEERQRRLKSKPNQ